MKKKKIFVITILWLSLFLGSCTNTYADVNNPINLDTLDYRDFEYIMIPSPTEVNLSFVSSTGFTNSALSIEKIQYYPASNETKYKFTSNIVVPDPWYTPGVEDYVFQDMNTGQLYMVSVDYTGLEIPLSETYKELIKLQNRFENLSTNYSNLQNMYTTLLNTSNNINKTLSQYINMSNISLDTGVKNLYDTFIDVNFSLDILRTDFNNLKKQYVFLSEKFNDTKSNLGNLTSVYGQLLSDYEKLNSTYNETYHLLLSKGANLSRYETFEQQINGYGDGFYFNGQYYRTLYSYNNQIKQLNDELGWRPIYIILTIILTVTILVGIYFFYYRNKIETRMEIEDKYGYDPVTHEINSFSLAGSLKDIWSKIRKQPDNGGPTSTVDGATKQDGDNREKTTDIRTEIDSQITQKIKPIQNDITALHKDVDKILSKL